MWLSCDTLLRFIGSLSLISFSPISLTRIAKRQEPAAFGETLPPLHVNLGSRGWVQTGSKYEKVWRSYQIKTIYDWQGIGMNAWDIPMYSSAMAGRLVGLTSGRVRRWLKGYEFAYSVGAGEIRKRHQEPVVRPSRVRETGYASFLNLVDLLFVKKFLDHGLSLQKIRRALIEAREIVGGYHFAHRNFFTDGKDVYLQVAEDGEALLELLSRGQWVIAPIIQQLAHQIVFDEPTGLAERWYPLGPEGLVVLDPRILFGRPSLVGRGVPTAAVYDFFVGEKENVKRVCSWMDLDEREVEVAVKFERRLAAA